jgi:hypothetical protein
MSSLSLEEDLLAFSAAVFLVRYQPCIFNVDMLISNSGIAEDINQLDFGCLDSLSLDINALHQAMDLFKFYFRSCVIGLKVTDTKLIAGRMKSFGTSFPAKSKGLMVSFSSDFIPASASRSSVLQLINDVSLKKDEILRVSRRPLSLFPIKSDITVLLLKSTSQQPTSLPNEDVIKDSSDDIPYEDHLTDNVIRGQYLALKSTNNIIYTPEERDQVLTFYDSELRWVTAECTFLSANSCISNKAIKQTITHLQTIKKYSVLTRRKLRTWIQQKSSCDADRMKRGPKVDLDFQREVWGHLITLAYKPDGVSDSVRLNANCVYSYQIVREAALMVQQKIHWIDNAMVQKLIFSNNWVNAFLKRNSFVRRKQTSEPKVVPDEDTVRDVMKTNQNNYINMEFTNQQTGNMDETAILYAQGPVYQFIPKQLSRATGIYKTSDRFRITGVVTALANGNQMPLMLIIKHSISSKERPDQTKMTVVAELFRQDTGFGPSHGWILECWHDIIAFSRDRSGQVDDHKVWYIRNKISLHVITSQHKAYMDTVRMGMYLDTIVEPYMKKEKLGQFFLWMDNYSAHNTEYITNKMEKLNITPAFLPSNMTSLLQVCDLHLNGPIKRKTRSKRALRTFQAFQDFHAEYDQMTDSEKLAAKFRPPKPSLEEGLQDVMEIFGTDGDFQKQSFQEGQKSCFVATGCAPTIDGGTQFIEYNEGSGTKGKKNLMLPVTNNEERRPTSMAVRSEEVFNEADDLLDAMNAFCDNTDDDDDYDDDNFDKI